MINKQKFEEELNKKALDYVLETLWDVEDNIEEAKDIVCDYMRGAIDAYEYLLSHDN